MAILVVLVLILAFPVFWTVVIQGGAAILELFWLVGSALYLLWRDRGSASQAPAAPKRKTTTKPRKPRAPIDPTLRKTRDMQVDWQHQGYRVGLLNLDTGEVFEPASVDHEKGDAVE